MSGVPIKRNEVPAHVVDELDFALDDYEHVCGENWNKDATPEFRKIDGTGYIIPAPKILGDKPHTFHATVDGESFVWSWVADEWFMVGEDL